MEAVGLSLSSDIISVANAFLAPAVLSSLQAGIRFKKHLKGAP